MGNMLKPEQVMARLNISKSSFRRLVQRHGIPYVRVGKLIRVPERALDAWIEARFNGEVEPESAAAL